MPDAPVPSGSQESIPIAPEDSAAFYRSLLNSLHDGIYFVDSDRKITYWNAGAERLTGYTALEAVGRHCYDNFLVHVNEDGCTLCVNGCPLVSTIADGGRREAEVYLRHKHGHRVPVSIRVAPIADGAGRILGAVEVFNDVTAKKQTERRVGELEKLAFRDALTGVPNRRYIEMKVKQAIQEFEQFGCSVGLVMIDIDHFKQVNDTGGHDVGDEALRAVCSTLTSTLRPGDMVGRLGGEEFLVIVSDVSRDTLLILAERCRMLIAESTVLAGSQNIKVTVSLGATLVLPGDTDQSAIKRADELMYRSKSDGRNRTTLG